MLVARCIAMCSKRSNDAKHQSQLLVSCKNYGKEKESCYEEKESGKKEKAPLALQGVILSSKKSLTVGRFFV